MICKRASPVILYIHQKIMVSSHLSALVFNKMNKFAHTQITESKEIVLVLGLIKVLSVRSNRSFEHLFYPIRVSLRYESMPNNGWVEKIIKGTHQIEEQK